MIYILEDDKSIAELVAYSLKTQNVILDFLTNRSEIAKIIYALH